MSLFLTIFSLALSPLAFGEDIIKTFPGGGAQDIINDTTAPNSKRDGALHMEAECIGVNKKVIQKGQNGYEQCLKDRLSRSNRGKPTGRTGGAINPMGQPTTAAPGQ